VRGDDPTGPGRGAAPGRQPGRPAMSPAARVALIDDDRAWSEALADYLPARGTAAKRPPGPPKLTRRSRTRNTLLL